MGADIILQFAVNLSLLMLAAFFYGLVLNHLHERGGRWIPVVAGILFGGIAIFAMEFPVEPAQGVIFDGRGIIVALAGPFAGGYGGLIAGGVAAAYRYALGGAGAMAGIAGIAAASLFGAVYWKVRGIPVSRYRVADFLAIGILLPAVSLPALFLLPFEVAVATLDKILIPIFLFEVVSVLILGIFLRNETNRASVRRRLQFSRQRFRDFVGVSSDYYWEMDAEDRFTYFSRQFEQVTGFPRESAVGLTRQELWAKLGGNLYAPDTQSHDLFHLVDSRSEFRRVRFLLPRPRGMDRVIEISGKPYFGPAGEFQGYRGVGLDVTREVQAIREKELALQAAEEAREAAILADRAKTDFLARMSHELRSPLNAVIGFADVLARAPEGPLGAAVYRDYVRNIQAAGSHLQELIGDILDLSRIESGRLALETARFSLIELAGHVHEIFTDAARERNNRMRLLLAKDLPAYVTGDPVRIRQVIENFLSNAIKFTSGGEIELAITVISREAGDVSLEISVSDTGIGLSPEQQEKVFDPFTQADGSDTRLFGGTGLGLSVCRKLVEGMGGEIGVESERETGSRFWVVLTLPCDDRIDEPAASPLAETHSQPLTLLVVDDIDVNRSLAKALLRMEGHQVLLASDGAEALAILHSDEGYGVDAILLDIHMPHMNGMDTARMIREGFTDRRRDVLIIALTADVIEENIALYHAAGMNAFVSKPLNMQELNVALLKLTGGGTPAHRPPPEVPQRAEGEGGVDIARLSVAFALYPDQDQAAVLDNLKSQCHQFIEAAQDAGRAHDCDALKAQLHTLKGVASNIGFRDLAALCRRLEERLKHQPDDGEVDLRDLTPALEAAIGEAARQRIVTTTADV